MQIIFSSKNTQLTAGLRTFITRKLTRLSKFTSLGLSHIFINFSIDKAKKGTTEDATVEIVSAVKDKQIVVREKNSTFFKAFFGAVDKTHRLLSDTKEKRLQKQR